MAYTGKVIWDASANEPEIDFVEFRKQGGISVVLRVYFTPAAGYELNNNMGGPMVERDAKLDYLYDKARTAGLPVELYFNHWPLCDLEGGYTKTQYQFDTLVKMTKNMYFQATWCSMERWNYTASGKPQKMTPPNMRASLEQMRSLAAKKWPTRPYGFYSSINYIKEADKDLGTNKDTQQIWTWLVNQFKAKSMRWWCAFYPPLVNFVPTKAYDVPGFLAMVPTPTTEQKKAYLFVGDSGPDVWQVSDQVKSAAITDGKGNLTAGDWDVTPLTKEQYYYSINWTEPNPGQPPDNPPPDTNPDLAALTERVAELERQMAIIKRPGAMTVTINEPAG